MGGKTETVRESKQSSTEPWAPARPLLAGILGQLGEGLGRTGLTAGQESALAGLEASARAGNPWMPQLNLLASDLFAGGPDHSGQVRAAFDALEGRLTPTARGDYLDPASNPFYATLQSTLADDIGGRVNAMFAGAGRDLSGANVQALARGIAQGTAPVFSEQWNSERTNQLDAIKTLFGGSNAATGLLSELDQIALANRRAGVGVAAAAREAADDPYHRLLAVEAARRGIPLDELARIVGMTVPIAGLGSNTSGSATSTTETREDPVRLAIGGILGALGLVGGTPAAARRFSGGAGAGYGNSLGGLGLPMHGGASRLY